MLSMQFTSLLTESGKENGAVGDEGEGGHWKSP